jgi:hypothetical protein
MSPGSICTPLASQINLALAFEADHRLVRHVVIVAHAFLSRREGQNVNAFSLETVTGQCDQTGAHVLRGNFYPVVQIPDRAARSDLVVTPKTRAPFFVNHKNPPRASCYTATRVIDNPN